MALDIGTSDAVALNAEIKASDGSERLNEDIVALNAETKNTTLNVKLETNDGSVRRTENTVMALNTETKK